MLVLMLHKFRRACAAIRIFGGKVLPAMWGQLHICTSTGGRTHQSEGRADKNRKPQGYNGANLNERLVEEAR